MKLQGVKFEETPKGKLKRIIIDASPKSEVMEDIVDTLLIEASKNEPMHDWEDFKKEMELKHKKK